MPNWSLVCFTLSAQGAVGLVWVGALGRWFAGEERGDLPAWPMSLALALTALGLSVALTHLARPRLAPKALGNLAASWLSREILLVQVFAALVLTIVITPARASSALVVLEIAAGLLGAAALLAMTRVYLLETVPAWNSAATPLEFAGSAALLGGVLGAVLATFASGGQSGWNLQLVVPGSSTVLGLILKVAAISPGLAAEQAARVRTWYEPAAAHLPAGTVLAIRTGLGLAGLTMVLAASRGTSPPWIWSCMALVCVVIAEVAGRQRFYNTYRRLGL